MKGTMTKRFALPDTLPDPYFTIDAGGGVVTVRTVQTEDGRSMAEVWRDEKILCRVIAKSIQVAEELATHSSVTTEIGPDQGTANQTEREQ
jgi:hypothetical protein